MNQTGESVSREARPRRRVVGRDVGATAPVRCSCYAAWSELTASPHDIDPRDSVREKLGVGAGLNYGAALDEIMRDFVERDRAVLKSEYSGLFEVGSDGPPVPIREDLQTGMRGGTREGIVRFYNFFGYSLADNYAWAPDHLSVQLEFMHFLCFREATTDSESAALSYQLAQLDFADRHLQRWVPLLADGVEQHSPDSIYARIARELQRFVAADVAWQNGTVISGEGGGD